MSALYRQKLNQYEEVFVDEFNGKFSVSLGSEYKDKLYPMKIKRYFGKEEKEARFSIRFDTRGELLEFLEKATAAVKGADDVPF